MSTTSANSQDDFLANLNAFAPTDTAGTPSDSFAAAPDTTYSSRTVSSLEESAKPQQEVVCMTCTSAMWFQIPSELRCFCYRMRMFSWQSRKPFPVIACDGWDNQPAEEK